tara:strand:- start:567 stop:1097 length:531 start_codon:yes stop_codon:yes gene_type:complete
MNKLFFLFFLLFGFHAYGCNNLLDTDLKILNEKEFKNLCEYSDHTILVVNTASKCGFTYQYEQLESLQRRFKDQKFTVLGFPSRNFMGQEFRDEEKVSEFCKATFDVSFPLFSIANVKNSTNHPFYKKIYKLTRERPSWNFHKYLITPEGEIKSFSHRIDPEDAQIVSAIQDSINL